MTRIHAGALLERPPGSKYLEALRFCELAFAGPTPKPATLRKWAADLPDDLVLGLVAPNAARRSDKGPLRFDDAMRAALDATAEAADALRARFVVLPTGSDLTTGQRDRDLVRGWVEQWPAHQGRSLVWHPSGLWDRELAIPFARQLGVIWGFDPLESAPPPGEVLYARLRAIGQRQRFTETLILDLLESLLASGADDAYVSIESERSFREARRLAEIAEAEIAEAEIA
jgi:uncharacterized protein YecE (DUF72 family)